MFWGRQVAAKWFPWAKLNFKCVDPPGNDHNFRLSGDWSNKMSVDDCKVAFTSSPIYIVSSKLDMANLNTLEHVCKLLMIPNFVNIIPLAF